MDIKSTVLAVSIASITLQPLAFASTAEGEEAYNQQRYEKAYMLLSEEAAKGDAADCG